MKNNYVIPKDLVFYIPKDLEDCPRCFRCEEGYQLATCVGLNEKKYNKYNCRCSLYCTLGLSCAYLSSSDDQTQDNEHTRAVIIGNHGFEFTILKSYSWDRSVYLGVESPEIMEKVGSKLMMKVDISNFLELLCNSGYVSGCKIHGTYRISSSCKYKDGKIEPKLEDPGDETYKESVVAGNCLSGKQTSKWIPGHKYILKTGTYIIYLGDLKDVLLMGARGKCTTYPLFSFSHYRMIYSSQYQGGSGKVFIIIDDHNKDLLEEHKGETSVEFLDFLLGDGYSGLGYYCKVRDDRSTKLTGSDLGEFFKVPDEDLDFDSLMKFKCRETLKANPDFPKRGKYWYSSSSYVGLISVVPTYFKENEESLRPLVVEEVKKVIRENLDSAYKYSRVANGAKKEDYKDYTYLVTRHPGYFARGLYFGDDHIYYMSEEEYKELVEQVIEEKFENV